MNNSQQNFRESSPIFYRIPALCYLLTLGVILHGIGLSWDISWHVSIGRDRLLTPPHLVILTQSMIIVGCMLWMASLSFFDKKNPYDPVSISLGKIKAPSGLWLSFIIVLLWMIAFVGDDWLHKNFGIDVEVLSATHSILYFGDISMIFGAIIVNFTILNSLSSNFHMRLWILTLICSSFLFIQLSLNLIELSFANLMHDTSFYYLYIPLIFPLIAIPYVSPIRYSSTISVLIYTCITLAMAWILSLIPATPTLGAIYNPITHFFPLPLRFFLLPVALVIDWFIPFYRNKPLWKTAIGLGGISFFVFFLTHWFWGDFLLSSWAGWFKPQWPFYTDIHQPFIGQFWLSNRLETGWDILQFGISLLLPLVGTISMTFLFLKFILFLRNLRR